MVLKSEASHDSPAAGPHTPQEEVVEGEAQAQRAWLPPPAVQTPTLPARSAQQLVGRQAPCPCGSSLKYKRCCGRSGKAFRVARSFFCRKPQVRDGLIAVVGNGFDVQNVLGAGLKPVVGNAEADRASRQINLQGDFRLFVFDLKTEPLRMWHGVPGGDQPLHLDTGVQVKGK